MVITVPQSPSDYLFKSSSSFKSEGVLGESGEINDERKVLFHHAFQEQSEQRG